MWSYDIIKRNKCVITIGETPRSGLSMIDPEASKEAGQEVKCAAPEHAAISVPCYFIKPPDFSFSSEFGEANDLVSNMLGGIDEALHTANLALPALDSLNGNIGEAMDAAGAIANSLGQSYNKDSKLSKDQFNADKRKAVMGALTKIGGIVKEVGSRETKTFRVGKVVDWKGSNPIEFSLEVLFCKPDDGVHMGVLYPIMEAASFSHIAFGNYLYGPRGYNSAGFGIGAIERILNGEFKSLHSLTLWHSAEDDFSPAYAIQRNIILDLFRLLVITSLNITKSEQLFFNPSKQSSAPLYKWIKATIGFKTACPIPGALWAVPGTGARAGGSNASLHDFYGQLEASYDAAYTEPISKKIADPERIPNEEDFQRLINSDSRGFSVGNPSG